MAKIVVDIRIDAPARERLEKLGDVYVADDPAGFFLRQAKPLPSDVIREAEILVFTVPPTNFEEAQQARLIQLGSVGYQQLYPLKLADRGIRACNARGVYDTPIAEWNISMMINLARDLRTMLRNQDQARWDINGRFHEEIRGRTVGVWGYGGIGRETARLSKALGLNVHVYARHGVGPRANTYCVPGTGDPEGKLPDRVFGPGEELDFLASIDFLVLALPQTPTSTGLIGERELRAMKPTAFLLNPARGPIVQEEPLIRALREGWIAGAALDTHYYYPMPPEHPFWSMPNVIMTPHISGSDRGPHFVSRIWEIALHNIEAYLQGQPLWNELTPEELRGER